MLLELVIIVGAITFADGGICYGCPGMMSAEKCWNYSKHCNWYQGACYYTQPYLVDVLKKRAARNMCSKKNVSSCNGTDDSDPTNSICLWNKTTQRCMSMTSENDCDTYDKDLCKYIKKCRFNGTSCVQWTCADLRQDKCYFIPSGQDDVTYCSYNIEDSICEEGNVRDLNQTECQNFLSTVPNASRHFDQTSVGCVECRGYLSPTYQVILTFGLSFFLFFT